MDTLRCYEAAAAGAIPIVLRNELWPMYRRLGFVIVQSIEEIDGLPKYAAVDTDITMQLSFSHISNQIFRGGAGAIFVLLENCRIPK